MAIPKLLDQMRHAVQDTGDTMTGPLTIIEPKENSEAASKNYVDSALENAGGTFYATYGSTTYEDVVAAYNAGKTVKALYSNTSSYIYIFDLVTRPTGSNILYFIARPYNAYANTYDTTCKLTSDSSWNIVSTSRRTSVSDPLQYNDSTPISTNPYYRPIRVSTSAPTSSDGRIGDIWIQYFS